jgi:hypothetical protein
MQEQVVLAVGVAGWAEGLIMVQVGCWQGSEKEVLSGESREGGRRLVRDGHLGSKGQIEDGI